MDNQQERFDVELSWLAGIIEGEGWVSLILYKNRQKKGFLPAFTPCIGMVNCDELIVNQVKYMFEKLGITYRFQIRKANIGTDGISRKARQEISAISSKNVRVLANAILPYMIGEKKERIKKVLAFLDLRDSKPRRGPSAKYGQAEFDIYNSLYSYKGKTTSKILNDFTSGLSKIESEDKV